MSAQDKIWLCGQQYDRCASTLFRGDVRCAHEVGHDGLHHSGHDYWTTTEADQPCPVCSYPIREHVSRKACLPAVSTGAKSLYDLPIFGWAWSEGGKYDR